MIKKLARWILKEEIDSKNKTINTYFDTVNRLENENKCIKDLRLKLKIAEQYIDDDEALLEVFKESKVLENAINKGILSEREAQHNALYGGGLFGIGQDMLALQANQQGRWI